ncbi:MAG: hypothetical protein ABIB71_01590 [Candidatus Woesearchaeota archaeon]
MDEGLMMYIVRETAKVFPHGMPSPRFEVIPRSKFTNFLMESPISEHFGDDAAFMAHIPEASLVCLCLDKFNELTKGMNNVLQNLLLEAAVLYELYHIWNENQASAGNVVMSKEQLQQKMGKEFPLWANLLEKTSLHAQAA